MPFWKEFEENTKHKKEAEAKGYESQLHLIPWCHCSCNSSYYHHKRKNRLS